MRSLLALSSLALLVACSTDTRTPGSSPADAAGPSLDAGTDAGADPADGGAPDTAADAAVDAGAAIDAGPADSGSPCGALTSCGGECVDLAVDRANCGACGRSCGRLEVCEAERCTCEDTCDGRCVDVFSDPDHCGACGNACGAGTQCLGGVCAARVPGTPGPAPALRVSPEGAACVPMDARQRPDDIELAIDAAGRFYVTMVCDGVPRVVTSTSWGQAYTAPIELPFPNVVALEIAAGGAGQLYAAATTDSGALLFARSDDGGETWDQPRVVDGGPVSVFGAFQMGLSIAVDRHQIVLAVANAERTRVRLWRNDDGGDGAFELVDLAVPPYGADVVIEPETREIWMMGDGASNFVAQRSRDGGRSFRTVHMQRATFQFGNYAVRGQDMFVIGSFHLVGTPNAPQRLQGLMGQFEPFSYGAFDTEPVPETRGGALERDLVLDGGGNVYFTASRGVATDSHSVSIFRVPAGSLVADAEISLGPRNRVQAGTRLHAGLGDGLVLVTYMLGAEVMASVIQFQP